MAVALDLAWDLASGLALDLVWGLALDLSSGPVRGHIREEVHGGHNRQHPFGPLGNLCILLRRRLALAVRQVGLAAVYRQR